LFIFCGFKKISRPFFNVIFTRLTFCYENNFISFFLVFLLSSCNDDNDAGHSDIAVSSSPVINYAVTNTYPHDTTSFTEGLLVYNGIIYESTGSPSDMPQTKSLFGTLDLSTGKINSKAELDKQKYFGEGICFLKDKIYQLTYQNKIGFIYDAKTFKNIGDFNFPSEEGWGLTTDGTHLIMSDGTDNLTYLEPADFKIAKKLRVSDERGAVMKLNELEYINQSLYANVYGTSTIIKIDPATGKVIARLDLSSLAIEAKSRYSGSMEMNGIAHDPASNKTFITGKMWPILFEIQFQK
jgi:glutamine cyclotransferase